MELEAPKCSVVERYMCWNISQPASADNLVKNWLSHFVETLPPVTVVRQCIRYQCFILLPNDWVVFKICFAILHNIVARNNVQPITFKQAKGKKSKFLRVAPHPGSHVTHLGHLLWAHGHMGRMLWHVKGVWKYFWML